ncbi:MAG TPA: glycoside hydrolase family 3 C-terminal domain-containing protein [Polyangia bacterium]|nr:glycoside hydrolase family 3 C-terminal domain-containing protein [Polyangia bacterium]
MSATGMTARAAAGLAALALAGCARARPAEDVARPSFGVARPRFLDPGELRSARVDDLVSRLTRAEKLGQLVSDAPAIPRLGVPAYHWWSEALHGVARAGRATVFPQVIGLAATFDPALVGRVAEAISDEARAKYDEAQRRGEHGRYQGLTFFSPNLNLFRDPRWGRGQETWGEDPALTSRLGVAFVRGMQGEDGRYLKTIATAKHFAAHSGPEAARHWFDARPSAHDLADSYLPQFEAAVRAGPVASVMPAYNRLDGVPCAADAPLLSDRLRGTWGFRGYVVSDCGAIGDIVSGHHAARTLEEAAAMALNAGTDLSCGGEYGALARALERGLVSDAAIDRAVKRLFAARFELGMFDPPDEVPWSRLPISVVESPEHRALARAAARASIVLLENRGGALPLGAGVRRLAVVGPVADDRDVLLGNYHGEPTRPITLLDGLRAEAGARGVEIAYGRGAPLAGGGGSSAQLADALRVARRADVVVATLGLSPRYEGEEGENPENPGGDRAALGLPAGQQRLLEALVATGKPVVLVLTSGSALSVPWAAAHVRAILEAWYPGEEGGAALAEVLFGAYSPAGRLPVTVVRSIEDLPPFEDYSMQGRTYRYADKEPLWAFGHGLGYATFRYGPLAVAPPADAGGRVEISVGVENTAARAADEVVEVYLSKPGAPAYAPRRWLAGFERVPLAPHERKTVRFEISGAATIVDEHGRRRRLDGDIDVAVGGRQPDRSWRFARSTDGVTARVHLRPPPPPDDIAP